MPHRFLEVTNLFTIVHDVTSKKTWIFRNTAVRT